MPPDIDRLCREVLSSRKYRDIAPHVVRRVCTDMAARFIKHADALHAARRELHRIHAAFLLPQGHERARSLLSAYEGDGLAWDRPFSRQLLALHASTSERLPYAEQAYGFISRHVAAGDRVVDVGCGFAPFALPFLGQAPASYLACDISGDTVSLLNLYFCMLGRPAYQAVLLDAARENQPPGDVVMMLKLLPLLEQQQKGRAAQLLTQPATRQMIISFPATSLTGKKRGMESTYAAFLEANLPNHLRIAQKELIGNELFYALGSIGG